jgi:serine/threonine-protein kinase RsbT
MPIISEIHVPITSDTDIVTARQQGRALAQRVGFNGTDLTVISTAISEVARNILEYALPGEIILQWVQKEAKIGIVVIARDDGPGILDVSLAMQDGFTTGKGLGLGLPGTRRLMDEFELVSKAGEGTMVTARKWRR